MPRARPVRAAPAALLPPRPRFLINVNSHQIREKSQTGSTAPAPLIPAVFLCVFLSLFLHATPAHAQSTNQLFMTGTGSGNAPTLYTNGVDSNINLAIMPKGTGNVGIGTTSPDQLLTISGPSSAATVEHLKSTANSTYLYLDTHSPSTYGIQFQRDGTVEWWLGNWSSASDSMIFYRSNNTTPVLALSPSSPYGVGIGNASPGSLLDIGLAGTTTGTLRLEGITSGYVQISPSAAAGSWTMTLPTGVPASNGYVLSSTTAGVTSWVANGGGGATALSSLTSGTAVNTIDNTSMAQTWTWNSLTTQTAFTLSSSSLTNGNILSIQNTAASATSTGKVLSISDATTGSGYGVYSSMTGHLNTGFAGYFKNTDTSSNTNFGVAGYVSATTTTGNASSGVYGEGDCGNCIGVNGYSTNNIGVLGTGGFAGVYALNTGTSNYAVYGTITGHGNTGYAGYFINTDTSSNSNWGVYGIVKSTGASVGVYGEGDCVSCSGVYGYGPGNVGVNGSGFVGVYGSGSTGGTTYGVYGTTNSTGAGFGVYGTITGHGNTGYAGYFTNTDTSTNVNYGIYGITLSTGSSSAGVYGQNDVGDGVLGKSANGIGTYGQSNNNTGVLGQGATAGVVGQAFSASGAGVAGWQLAAGNTAYGGYFTNTGTGAINYGLYASTSSATGWAGYFDGNIYLNGTITMSSDNRLKKDIEPLDTADALDEITALRPVAFTWKKTGVSDMGLIAQEVDLVYPDLVTHSAADETLALKYTSLIAPMIASIQELKKRDDDLEIENAALRRDFDAYKAAHP